MMLTACCDVKGRILANFWITQSTSDYYLLIPTLMLATFLEHLKKYAVFSKIEINVPSKPWKIFNVIGSNEKLPTEPGILKRIFAPNLKGFQPRQFIFGEEVSISVPISMEDTWKKCNIQDGIVMVYPSTSGTFIPQMINLELFGGVSFTKGCYLGQEIIARTQHLGILKRHLYRGTIKGIHAPGSDIVDSQQQKVGIIAEITQHQDDLFEFLAVIEDRAFTHSNSLRVIEDVILDCELVS